MSRWKRYVHFCMQIRYEPTRYTCQNLREEVAMDVDEDESGTQPVKKAQDFGIEVDFQLLDDEEREDGSPEALARFDKQIANINTEIDKMAPNLKAMERLTDVETKLAETEKEADRARKDSKQARDQFNEIKKRRYVFVFDARCSYSNVSQMRDVQ